MFPSPLLYIVTLLHQPFIYHCPFSICFLSFLPFPWYIQVISSSNAFHLLLLHLNYYSCFPQQLYTMLTNFLLGLAFKTVVPKFQPWSLVVIISEDKGCLISSSIQFGSTRFGCTYESWCARSWLKVLGVSYLIYSCMSPCETEVY